MPIALEPLLPHLPAWAMVLFRLSGIFLLAPVFGSSSIPVRVKVFLAVGLSLCVYPMLLAAGRPSAAMWAPMIDSGLSLWTLVGAALSELMIGLVLGFGATLPLIGMQVAGQVIDQQMGLGLAGIFNPELNEQTGITGEFLFMMALSIFLILGGHRVLLATLIGTFDHIPPGGFHADGQLIHLLTGLMAGMFELALRISAPLLCLVFLESIALGFVARTVPQINLFSIGFAVRIFIGSSLVIAGIAVKAAVYQDSMRWTLRRLAVFFGA